MVLYVTQVDIATWTFWAVTPVLSTGARSIYWLDWRPIAKKNVYLSFNLPCLYLK